jgi:hypothetical protein
MSSIGDLQAWEPSSEYRFAPLARFVLDGVNTPMGFIKMVKHNDITGPNDESRYDVDFRIEVDGETVGYLDIEEKRRWSTGGWPYGRVNVAKHPMKQWVNGVFGSRPTNKICAFREKPDASFWVGVRADYEACLVVPARHVLNAPEADQSTGYSDVPLPVYVVDNEKATFVSTAERFRDVITQEVFDHVAG